MAMELLATTKPTAAKAMDALVQAGILQEITGKRRDRVYAYRSYLTTLSEDAGQVVEDRRQLKDSMDRINRTFDVDLKRLAE